MALRGRGQVPRARRPPRLLDKIQSANHSATHRDRRELHRARGLRFCWTKSNAPTIRLCARAAEWSARWSLSNTGGGPDTKPLEPAHPTARIPGAFRAHRRGHPASMHARTPTHSATQRLSRLRRPAGNPRIPIGRGYPPSRQRPQLEVPGASPDPPKWWWWRWGESSALSFSAATLCRGAGQSTPDTFARHRTNSRERRTELAQPPRASSSGCSGPPARLPAPPSSSQSRAQGIRPRSAGARSAGGGQPPATPGPGRCPPQGGAGAAGPSSSPSMVRAWRLTSTAHSGPLSALASMACPTCAAPDRPSVGPRRPHPAQLPARGQGAAP